MGFLAADYHGADRAMTAAIDICICTFRRPQLAATLASLAQQITARPLRLIVADNDETPAAQPLVAAFRARHPQIAIDYYHAPARNISIARNACLDAATAPLVAFIDDDETATPGWIEQLTRALDNSAAAIALGPVQPIYDDACPAYLRRGDFHATRPAWVKGEIVTGYTCNVIMRRAAIGALRFRPELGQTGGEDTLFFAALFKQGARIVFAEQAVVTELVAPSRQNLRWLLRRAFRSGQTHGLLLLERNRRLPARCYQLMLAVMKAVFCALMTLVSWQPRRGIGWLLRGALHAGVVARLLGKGELVQYG